MNMHDVPRETQATQSNPERNAGATEYDSWLARSPGAAEYDSWSFNEPGARAGRASPA